MKIFAGIVAAISFFVAVKFWHLSDETYEYADNLSRQSYTSKAAEYVEKAHGHRKLSIGAFAVAVVAIAFVLP